jgi:hypothetical protein
MMALLSTLHIQLGPPMTSLLDSLSGHLDDQALSRISGTLGADQGATSKALAAAVPLLLAGLAHNASQPGGAQQLHDALARDHDGSALDQPPARPSPDGDAILGHILGDRRAAAERGIAGASGLDLSKVGPLLSMLAPVVMGALGRARSQGGLGPGQLSDVLNSQGAALGASSGVMGMVAGLLDRDHDGSVVDDVGGMLGNFFRRQ